MQILPLYKKNKQNKTKKQETGLTRATAGESQHTDDCWQMLQMGELMVLTSNVKVRFYTSANIKEHRTFYKSKQSPNFCQFS